MMRLRQIALVTPELRPVEQDICNQLGLEVCYRDPGLAHFGLRHGLYAIGDQLLEVVAPKQPGTTAGRFLERRGGEGGYMILLQTDDVEQHKSRVESAGMRVVHDGEIKQHGAAIRGIHLHPKDVGGAILSLDQAQPKESWLWAGHDWQYHSLDGVVTDMVAVDIQAEIPMPWPSDGRMRSAGPSAKALWRWTMPRYALSKPRMVGETVWRRQICALRIGPERAKPLTCAGFSFAWYDLTWPVLLAASALNAAKTGTDRSFLSSFHRPSTGFCPTLARLKYHRTAPA